MDHTAAARTTARAAYATGLSLIILAAALLGWPASPPPAARALTVTVTPPAITWSASGFSQTSAAEARDNAFARLDALTSQSGVSCTNHRILEEGWRPLPRPTGTFQATAGADCTN